MDSLYGSACGAYIYDEDVLDFLVKYDNNLAGEMRDPTAGLQNDH